jgi:acyl-coenzyme A synthetase/AMP-(fatty) acid ligase
VSTDVETTPTWGELHERIAAVFELGGDEPELQYLGRWWTWNDLARIWAEVHELAVPAVFDGPDALGIVARNHPAVVAALTGTMRDQRTYVSLNPLYPDAALAEDIGDTRPHLVLGVAADVGRESVLAVAREKGIQVLELPEESDGHVRELVPAGEGSGWFAASAEVAVSMLTSGTTGKAKRIAITAQSLRDTVIEAQEHSGISVGPVERLAKGVSLHHVPPAHIGSLFGILMTMSQGRKAALLGRYAPQAWADLVEEHGVVMGSLPPAAIRSLLDADIPKEKLASLRYIGAGSAPLRLEDADELYRRYGIPVLQAYGATEFSGGLTSFTALDHRRWGDAKRGSVGRPHPGVGLKVVDLDTGADLPAREKGRLLARTSHSQAGDASVWIETNDLASIDEDGFLYIHGRLDDVIVRGGFKIDPAEVRDVLIEHPAVKDAAVVGASDERLGSVPVAGVELAPGGEVTERELKDWVRERLSPYKVPTRIKVLEALPRNVSMKVIKPELLARLAED